MGHVEYMYLFFPLLELCSSSDQTYKAYDGGLADLAPLGSDVESDDTHEEGFNCGANEDP